MLFKIKRKITNWLSINLIYCLFTNLILIPIYRNLDSSANYGK